MTIEERRKAAEWFRNRAKNCPMPGARRMYEIATEALEMAIRALEGDGDMISRQAVMKEFSDFVRKSNNSDFAQTPTWNDAVSLVGSMPSAQPERLTDDDFETIRIHLNAYKEKLCNQQRWEEAEEYQRIIDRFMAFASARKDLRELPSAQPEVLDCGSGELVKDSQRLVEASSNDIISRQQAIEAFEPEHHTDWYTPTIIKTLEELPSAQQERIRFVQQAVITIMNIARSDSIKDKSFRNAARMIQNAIDGEPQDFEPIPDEPERKKGKWIKLDMHAHIAGHKCTACGQECYVPTCMGEPMYDYCPNCGARME